MGGGPISEDIYNTLLRMISAQGDDEDIPAGSQWHNGVFGGGQLGFNYQIGHFVLGIEGDFAYSDVGGERTLGLGQFGDDVNTITTNNNWTGTIAARLGYAFDNNHLLAYAKGGVAIEHWEYDWTHVEILFSQFTDRFSSDDTRTEPMIGFGVEYMFNCRWSAKLEFRYVFLGADNVVSTLVEGAGDNELNESYQVDLRQASVQFGLNYTIW